MNLQHARQAAQEINTAEAAIAGVTNVLSYQVARPVAAGELRLVLPDYEPRPDPGAPDARLTGNAGPSTSEEPPTPGRRTPGTS